MHTTCPVKLDKRNILKNYHEKLKLPLALISVVLAEQPLEFKLPRLTNKGQTAFAHPLCLNLVSGLGFGSVRVTMIFP